MGSTFVDLINSFGLRLRKGPRSLKMGQCKPNSKMGPISADVNKRKKVMLLLMLMLHLTVVVSDISNHFNGTSKFGT